MKHYLDFFAQIHVISNKYLSTTSEGRLFGVSIGILTFLETFSTFLLLEILEKRNYLDLGIDTMTIIFISLLAMNTIIISLKGNENYVREMVGNKYNNQGYKVIIYIIFTISILCFLYNFV